MQKARGFTLLEVVVVLAVIAILTSLAAPSFTSLIQSNAVSSNVNAFMADLRFARSEAIRRGGSVVMCRSNDPEAVTPVCDANNGASGNGWVSGWIIFENRDGVAGYLLSAGDQLLRVQGPITNLDSIVGPANTTFEFVATGRLRSLNSAKSMQFGSNMPNERQRMVCVNGSGRARIAGDGNASCTTDN